MIDSYVLRKLLARSGLARFVPSVRRALAGGEDYLRFYSDRTLAVPLDHLADPALLPTVHTPDAINLALGSPPCEVPPPAVRGLADRRPASVFGSEIWSCASTALQGTGAPAWASNAAFSASRAQARSISDSRLCRSFSSYCRAIRSASAGFGNSTAHSVDTPASRAPLQRRCP